MGELSFVIASVGDASPRREPLTSEREGPWVVFGFPAWQKIWTKISQSSD
jgi:hypothetical protein